MGCAAGTQILLFTQKYLTGYLDQMVALSYNEENDKWTVLGDLPNNITLIVDPTNTSIGYIRNKTVNYFECKTKYKIISDNNI